MSDIVGPIPQQSWLQSCASAILAQNLTTGLVDRYGQPMSAYSNLTGGITVQACYTYCGPTVMYQSFNYGNFSTAFTNWLLPWIALAAQLPYQASGPANNIMSALLALGSPALITYSLSLTILNRFWIRRRFAKLKKESHAVAEWAPHLSARISAAMDLLQDAQQAPLRISQEDGWLSSLIVLRDNQTFWETVRKDLGNTRRGFSASLFAQMLMACIAFVFIIISAFVSDLGEQIVALQLATGSIWIWMIPVILGWILVSTQSRAGSINDALEDCHHRTFRALDEESDEGKIVVEERQCGILSRSGLNPFILEEDKSRPSTADSKETSRKTSNRSTGDHTTIELERFPSDYEFPASPMNNPNDRRTVPGWLGFNVCGDEREEGPIYNFNRIFTWFQSASQIEHGFSTMLYNLHQNKATRRQVNTKRWVSSSHKQDQFVGTSEQVAAYCGIPLGNLDAYTPWPQIPARVWQHFIFASFFALFVQWGTTGPAILIAFLTPTKGFGCRSGSYTLYGVASTCAWFLLTCSSLLSHGVMLRYQTQHTRTLGHGVEEPRKLGLTLLCAAAVCTRILGKTLVVMNAGWLVLFSFLEYIGTFQTCWCDANVLGMGSHGWAAIFMTTSELASAATSYWAGGLVFSLLVCGVSMAFFWLASGDTLDGAD